MRIESELSMLMFISEIEDAETLAAVVARNLSFVDGAAEIPEISVRVLQDRIGENSGYTVWQANSRSGWNSLGGGFGEESEAVLNRILVKAFWSSRSKWNRIASLQHSVSSVAV